jgi:hypothetical protein
MIALALAERPKLITIGGSLNLFEHPVADIRAIADGVGAKVMFDAAHRCGIIAWRAWSPRQVARLRRLAPTPLNRAQLRGKWTLTSYAAVTDLSAHQNTFVQFTLRT